MKSVIKKVGVGTVAVLATLSSAGAASASQVPEISTVEPCQPYVDEETDAGALHLKRCHDAVNNKMRVYGYMEKYRADTSCVRFTFSSVPDSYQGTWSVCEPGEYTNLDTAYRTMPVRYSYVIPR